MEGTSQSNTLHMLDDTTPSPKDICNGERCERVLLGMAQVIMMFAQPFWPADFFDVVCTDSFIPEFWITSPPLLTPTRPLPASEHTGLHDAGSSNSSPQHAQHAQQQQSAEPPVHCMVGFVAGSKAEEISKLRQNSVIIQTLSQLDQMFGKRQLLCSCLAMRASDLHLHGGLTAMCIWVEIHTMHCNSAGFVTLVLAVGTCGGRALPVWWYKGGGLSVFPPRLLQLNCLTL